MMVEWKWSKWLEDCEGISVEKMRPDAIVKTRAVLMSEAEEKLAEKDKRIFDLENALIAHRDDLHEGSSRPCPTCQQSAKVLGFDLDRCAHTGETKELIPIKKKK